jgi:xylulokinase
MSSEKCLIGVDIGTQGTKAALFAESGKLLATAFRPSNLHQPKPGIVEEDPETQFASVCDTIRTCVKTARVDASSVAGIGIDGQMAGILGVGKDGRNVTPYDSWLDTRCTPYIRKMEQKAGDEVVSKTGCAPSFNHGPKILWWKGERKEVYRTIQAFVLPGGYAAMRLCGLDGARAFFDATCLPFSGFASTARAAWDPDLCKTFSVDIAKLPQIPRPHTVVGEVRASAARLCGLKPGVPVIAGCGDAIASFLACGAVQEGICVDVAGTASIFATTTTSFRADTKSRMLICAQSATPGLWHSFAYVNGGGMNLEWFRREIANRGMAGAKEALSFDQLNTLAANLEATDDLPLFIPHLRGRVCPNQPHLRGAWAGLTWHHGVAHLYRAVLEGVALEYALYQKAVSVQHRSFRPKELRITGGGEKSTVWNALKADILQTPVRRVARSEGAALGVALLAGFGTALFRSIPAVARSWIGLGEAVRPNKSRANLYARRLGWYEALLCALNDVVQH